MATENHTESNPERARKIAELNDIYLRLPQGEQRAFSTIMQMIAKKQATATAFLDARHKGARSFSDALRIVMEDAA